jgi:hypothetical protein
MSELKDGHVRVRMYNVGFGDCFLILIPGDPVRTILVDAGFHSQGKGSYSSKELTRQILDDLIAYTGKQRADVVVGTHRHQDHITSFNDKQWKDLQIGEVWLPWVDNPKDKVAKKLWKKKTSFAIALTEALPAFAATMSKEAKHDTAFMLWNAGVPYDALAKFAGWSAAIDPVFGVSNAEALAILRTGFASRDVEEPRYLPTSDTYPEAFETDILPGVRVHVLGPPKARATRSSPPPRRHPKTPPRCSRRRRLQNAGSYARTQLPSRPSPHWSAASSPNSRRASIHFSPPPTSTT